MIASGSIPDERSQVDQVLAEEDVNQAINAAGRVLWHLGDQLGSTRDLADNTGVLATHYKLDAFGGIKSGDTGKTRYIYTNQEYDPDTGLWYFNARWYDPALGRFLSEDPNPAGTFADGANNYAYVHNGPTNGTDPTGLVIDTIWDIGNVLYDVAVGDWFAFSTDIAAMAVPFVPAGGSKALKWVRRADGAAIEAVRHVDDAGRVLRVVKVEYKYLGKEATKSKHFLPQSARKTNWVAKTKDGPAKFNPGDGDGVVREYIDKALQRAKKEGKGSPDELSGYVFDVGKNQVVGAANGKCTTKIKLQVDSVGNIHAHPY